MVDIFAITGQAGMMPDSREGSLELPGSTPLYLVKYVLKLVRSDILIA
jgi:hypothetical protein